LIHIALALLLGASVPVVHAAGTAPIVKDADRFAAAQVRALPDGTPWERLKQVLEARSLSQAALFELASTNPTIVQQVIDPKYQLVYDFVAGFEPGDLFRARQGETIVRDYGALKKREKAIVDPLAATMGFKKYKPEKIKAVRIGPLKGEVYRFDVVYQVKKKKTEIRSLQVGWPSTPTRDDEARNVLAKHFGARPSRVGRGAGAALPVVDPSFEQQSIGTAWQLVQVIALGDKTIPVNEVSIAAGEGLDGNNCLRFYGEERTRLFHEAAQAVPVPPGARLRAKVQFRAENLRVEFHQRDDIVGMTLSFLDAGGNPVGPARRAIGRLATHPWEQLMIEETAPYEAAAVRIALMSAVSGTAYFDGVEIEIIE
jgi:hypothetical protein